MANIEDRVKYTERGFSYVEVTPQENMSWGGMCVCNSCNEQFTEENMYLSFVLADTYCKKCWENILKRQKTYSQEDVDYDLALQNRNHLDWYKYHLDKDFRNKVLSEEVDFW